MKIEDAFKIIEDYDNKNIIGPDAFNKLAFFLAFLGTKTLNYSPENYFEFSKLFKMLACRFDKSVYSFVILSNNVNFIKFLILNELINDEVIEEMRIIVNEKEYNNDETIYTFLKVNEFYNDYLLKIKLNDELNEAIENKATSRKRRM